MRVSGWLLMLEQALSSLCLLYALGRMLGIGRGVTVRVGVVSLLCGLWATLGLMLTPSWLRLCFLPLPLVAPLFAFPRIPRSLRGRLLILHGALALLLSGSMQAGHQAGLPGLLLLPVVFLLPLLIRRPLDAAPRCVLVEIVMGARRCCLTALVDSGNLLRDPLTSLPVVVCSRRALSQVTVLPESDLLRPGMRLISVRTAAGSTLMVLLHPDRIRMRDGGLWHEVQAMVGLFPQGYDGYQALVPSSLTRPTASATQAAAASQGG